MSYMEKSIEQLHEDLLSKKVTSSELVEEAISKSKEVQEKFAKATQSFMYNKNVVYEGDYQSIANALKWINRYATVPDFNIGAYANRNKSLLDSIVAGAGTKTFEDAKSAQLEIRSNMLLGMQDKIMNPPNGLGWIKPVYTKKTYDDSWLTN